MREEKIKVQKTARIIICGNEIDPENIWIILHGYAQLATEFSEKFKDLTLQKNLLIFPEGMHRFYTKGANGRVGASWMTKESRLDDIEDNFHYLEEIIKKYRLDYPNTTVNLFGFSQGGAIACRWLKNTQLLIDNLILYGATFPSDLKPDFDFGNKIMRKILFVLGDSDQYISKEEKTKQILALKLSGKEIIDLSFEGGHDIKPEILLRIENNISAH